MGFQVVSIRTRIVDHLLNGSRIIASPAGRHDTSRFVTVAVRDAQGHAGYGEAATTTLWSGETAETAQCVIEQLFAPHLVGRSFDHPSEALAIMDTLCVGNSFAKGALDTALWDLWARGQNLPAATLFADRDPIGWIPTRASVGCYDAGETVRIAAEFHAAGIRTLKFKIGIPGIDDVARLRAVREHLGDEVTLTVDANGAYQTVAEAVTAVEALAPFGLSLVEQPTPRDRISLLAQVRRAVSIPIMADECVFTMGDLQEAIDLHACDSVSLYPGKNGGVTRVIEMAQEAQRAGIKCAIGSNLETDLGQASMAALASALEAFPVEDLACDLAGPLYYREPSTSVPSVLRDGRLQVPAGAGFGVEPAGAPLV